MKIRPGASLQCEKNCEIVLPSINHDKGLSAFTVRPNTKNNSQTLNKKLKKGNSYVFKGEHRGVSWLLPLRHLWECVKHSTHVPFVHSKTVLLSHTLFNHNVRPLHGHGSSAWAWAWARVTCTFDSPWWRAWSFGMNGVHFITASL